MGYYTDFEVVCSEEVLRVIIDISGISGYDHDDWDGNRLISAKWYSHDDHLINISKKFPEELISVLGYGEETGDYWKKFYKNGKRQLAELTFTEFDESKL